MCIGIVFRMACGDQRCAVKWTSTHVVVKEKMGTIGCTSRSSSPIARGAKAQARGAHTGHVCMEALSMPL